MADRNALVDALLGRVPDQPDTSDVLARMQRWGGLKSYAPDPIVNALRIAAQYRDNAMSYIPPQALFAANFMLPGKMRDYRSSYRNEYTKPSSYDPEFFSTQPDVLRDEAGKAIAYKSRLVPQRDIADENIIAHSPDLIHRGMSYDEYQNIIKNGFLQSRGAYNIGDSQQGLTYYTTRPASAASYASSFAPSRFKPEPGRDAYVVSVRRPSDDRIRMVEGTDPSEVGVIGAIPASDIAAIYRGRVIAHTPEYRSSGFRSAPSSRLNWERLDDVLRKSESQ